jgi:hypothetical protein
LEDQGGANLGGGREGVLSICGHYAHAPIVADATFRRIEQFIANQLGKVAQDATGWKALYRAPRLTTWWMRMEIMRHRKSTACKARGAAIAPHPLTLLFPDNRPTYALIAKTST